MCGDDKYNYGVDHDDHDDSDDKDHDISECMPLSHFQYEIGH